MKNPLRLCLLGIALLAGYDWIAYAAQTCQRTDMFCYESGPSQNLQTVGRLDSGGNLTLEGNSAVSGNETVTGNQTITGNQTVTGNSSITGNQTISKFIIYPSSNNVALVAGKEILPVSSYMTFQATGAAVTMAAALPELSTATSVGGGTKPADGTWLVLSSTGTNTIQFWDNGTVAGSQLRLGSTNRLVGTQKTLTLIYNAALNMWIEQAFANN